MIFKSAKDIITETRFLHFSQENVSGACLYKTHARC